MDGLCIVENTCIACFLAVFYVLPSSGPPRPKAPSHSQAARALSLGTPVDPEDEIDSGSESDGEGHTPVHYYEPEDSPVQVSWLMLYA